MQLSIDLRGRCMCVRERERSGGQEWESVEKPLNRTRKLSVGRVRISKATSRTCISTCGKSGPAARPKP